MTRKDNEQKKKHTHTLHYDTLNDPYKFVLEDDFSGG